MNAASTPVTELRGLSTPPAADDFWDELHDRLIAAALQEDPPSLAVAGEVAVVAPRVDPRHRRPAASFVAVAAAAVIALVIGVATVGAPGGADRPPGGPTDTSAQRPDLTAVDGVATTASVVTSGGPPISVVDESTPPEATASAADGASFSTSDGGVPLERTLVRGSVGDDVRAVQQRLADLKFDPGPIDGVFGQYTAHAVWAFETLVMGVSYREVTGEVTPEMWERLQQAVTIAPRRTDLTPTHVEIYLPEQALVAFTDGEPAVIAHISSGMLVEPGDDFTRGVDWCAEVRISPGEPGNENGTDTIVDGRCGNSETPGGTYRVYRKVEGRREAVLGGMYDPLYFNDGIAIYGASTVPSVPESFGGIRVSRQVMPAINALVSNLGRDTGDQVYVWNGVKEPEDYGARPGWFDVPDLE